MNKEGRGAKQPGSGREMFLHNLVDNAKSYAASAGLLWLAVLFYRTDPYYLSYLYQESQHILVYLALAYSVGGLFFYLYMSERKVYVGRGLIIVRAVRRLGGAYIKYLRTYPTKAKYPLPKPTEPERVSLLFAAVKLFFLPLMINFVLDNYHGLKGSLDTIHAGYPLLSAQGFDFYLYPVIFSLFLLVDTSFFLLGYSTESDLLRNKVRSVEPTFFGWAVALISYPPFNAILGGYVIWSANDYAFFSSARLTAVVRVFLLLLMGTYASASVALGPKASNLTNRGTVSWGPYRYVRHPAYITKNLFWFITVIPAISLGAVIGSLVWGTVYFLRAITEERHLIRDPDYQAYCKKVRWRFIPGIV